MRTGSMGNHWFLRFTFCLLTTMLLSSGTSGEVNITMVPTSLTFTPQQLDRGEKGQVSVNCTYTPQRGLWKMDLGLQQMSIRRIVQGKANNVNIVSATMQGKGVVELTADIPGASVSGHLWKGSIAISMKEATCRDQGQYFCEAHFDAKYLFADDMTVITEQGQQNLSVDVTPGPVQMTVSPKEKSTWTVGDIINMTCEKALGTDESKKEVEIVWQYLSGSGRSWKPYDAIKTPGNHDDVVNDITDDVTTCYKRGRSRLTRTLTANDSQRVYRCSFKIGGASSDQNAGLYRIGDVVEAKVGPVSPPPTSSPEGMVVVMVMVVVVVVSLSVGVAVALWKRQLLPCKRGKDRAPLVPPHRDPGSYGSGYGSGYGYGYGYGYGSGYGEYLEPRRGSGYGEYLEPIDHVPVENEQRTSGIYTEVPDVME